MNVWDLMCDFWKAHGKPQSSFTGLTLSMYDAGNDDFPLLKGRAQQIKTLGLALLHAFEELMDRDNQVHRWIRLGLRHSIAMDDILDGSQGSFKFSQADAAAFVDHTYNFLALLTALRTHYGPQPLFHITIKAHYLIHIAIMSKYINPRLGWCYTGEDFVGRLRKVIAICLRGTPPRYAVSKTIIRYCHGMSYTLNTSGLK